MVKGKNCAVLKRIAVMTALCALPYAVLPPICEWLPEGIVWGVSFLLCHLLLPVSAIGAPYSLARKGVPAIAAWPWPVLCSLILPLWGLRPGVISTVLGIGIALVSAVAGEEMKRRKDGVYRQNVPRRTKKRRR